MMIEEVNNMDTELDKKIKELIRKEVPEILKGSAFTDRKLTDTPTDANSVVPRKYVTMNGTVANRPNSSVATVGQFYLSTDTNIPSWYTAGGWRNGVGSIIAQA